MMSTVVFLTTSLSLVFRRRFVRAWFVRDRFEQRCEFNEINALTALDCRPCFEVDLNTGGANIIRHVWPGAQHAADRGWDKAVSQLHAQCGAIARLRVAEETDRHMWRNQLVQFSELFLDVA